MQSFPRLYFVFPSAPFEGMVCSVPKEAAHYVLNVMRRKKGDEVVLFNATAGEWETKILDAKKNQLSVEIIRQIRPPAPVADFPVLAFAPLKRDASDLVIRMGTELGVSRFVPVVTQRTNTHRINRERMEVIAKEAAEQCERLDIPICEDLQMLEQFLGLWPTDAGLGIALERMNEQLKGPPQENNKGQYQPVENPPPMRGLLIGPEGGFAPQEVRLLQTFSFVRPFSLGPRILRAETAALAALALFFAKGHEDET